MTLLGGLTPRRFLARHWQKRPLLVRGALPGFRDPVSREQLMALACEESVESRLVLEKGGTRPWQVIHGPQEPGRLRRLGRSHWTLLLQEADRHVPALALLLDRFAFVPHWRVDDVMLSFAAPRGSVGPHLDSYDVFLIQGAGRRRWQINSGSPGELRPGLDLRVLRGFRPERDWILEPGDLLYLPPGVAHYGVALEDCFTYSVGFRAPSHLDLLLGYMQRVANGVDRSLFYRDPDLRPQRLRGEITPGALRRLRRIVTAESGRVAGREFDRFVGELLTEAKGVRSQPRRRRLTAQRLAARLSAGAALARSPASRIAFIQRGPGSVELFVDGGCRPLSSRLSFAGPLLSGARVLPQAAVAAGLSRPGFVQLLADLVNAGALELAGPRR